MKGHNFLFPLGLCNSDKRPDLANCLLAGAGERIGAKLNDQSQVSIAHEQVPVTEKAELATEPAPAGLLRVKVCRRWAELEALRRHWDELLRTNASYTIFSTPEWLGAWWKAFGNEKQLVALLFLDSNEALVGFVSLYLERLQAFPWRLRRLRFVGDGTEDSDNLDFVVRPGDEERLARTFVAWVAQQPGWDLCEFNTVPANSTVGNHLRRCLEELGWTYTIHRRPGSVIILPVSWESYLAQVSKKERTKLRYRLNRLERRYRLCFYKCTEEKQLPACLDALFQLHQKRWVLNREEGSFAWPARQQFYYEMARAFLARKWLEFWLLELDGKIVATQFGFRYRDTVFSLQEGFDPAYAQDSVGYVLRAHVLRQLIAQGVRRYDFLGGQDASKERWGTQTAAYTDIRLARPFSRGSAYLRLRRSATQGTEWLRASLPGSVFARLRGLYRAFIGTPTPST